MVELPPEDEEKARKLLAALQPVEQRKPVRRLWRWLPLIITIALVLAIVLVLAGNWSAFTAVWNRLARPDLTPQ